MPYVPGPSCLIVSADTRHVHNAKRELTRLLPRLRHESAPNSLQAVRRAGLGGLDLVLVDLAIDGASGPALVRHLNRIHPALDVLAFDHVDALAPAPGQAANGWAWTQLALVLEQWVLQQSARGAASA